VALSIPSSPVAFDGDNGAPTHTGGAENTNTGGRAPPSGLSFHKRAATAGGVGTLTLRQPDNIAYRVDICSFDFTGDSAADHPILTSSGGGSSGGEHSLFTSGDGCSAEFSNFADDLRRSQVTTIINFIRTLNYISVLYTLNSTITLASSLPRIQEITALPGKRSLANSACSARSWLSSTTGPDRYNGFWTAAASATVSTTAAEMSCALAAHAARREFVQTVLNPLQPRQ
jgi:hypothetical protein